MLAVGLVYRHNDNMKTDNFRSCVVAFSAAELVKALGISDFYKAPQIPTSNVQILHFP